MVQKTLIIQQRLIMFWVRLNTPKLVEMILIGNSIKSETSIL